MNVGFVTSNDAFSKPIIDELNRRGHEVLQYRHTDSGEQNAFQLGQLKANTDRVFVDWAQTPLEHVLAELEPETHPIFCRAHRIEMYNDAFLASVPWHKLACMFFIAEHVKTRFLEKVSTPPRNVVVVPHVGIDGDFWTIDEATRKWEPPWTIVLAGNIVPKKRVYTAVQLLYDLPEGFHLAIYGGGRQDGYGNHEYPQNVTDLVQDLGLTDRVHGSPPVPQEELREAFQRAHFVLSASNEEGCATVVAEGMACGCVPLVNAWRGAEKVYPEEWIWRSPKEFYELIEQWRPLVSWSDERDTRSPELPQQMRDLVLPKYGSRAIARQICDVVTGPLDAKTVGEWYSTEKLAHMIEQDGNARQQAGLTLVEEFLPEGDACVLELGCGTGWLSRQLAQRGIHAAGQDVAEGLLAWTTEHNPGEARFELADATQRIVKGPWDVITAIDVLEHIPGHFHEALMMRVAEQVKPGGYFLARFPHSNTDNQIVEEHVFPKVLRLWCKRAGLETERFGLVSEDSNYFELVARKGAV